MTREEAARWLAERVMNYWPARADATEMENAFLALTAPQPASEPAPATCACGATATHKETAICTPRDDESERAEFEAWLRDEAAFYGTHVTINGDYVSTTTQLRWRAWQAARRGRKP